MSPTTENTNKYIRQFINVLVLYFNQKYDL